MCPSWLALLHHALPFVQPTFDINNITDSCFSFMLGGISGSQKRTNIAIAIGSRAYMVNFPVAAHCVILSLFDDLATVD
jgi:hypothetical protein